MASAATTLMSVVSVRNHAPSQMAHAASSTRKTLFLSVNPKNVVAVARKIQRWGGTIRFEQDAVGYIRAAVPPASIMQVEQSSGVDAFEVDDAASEEQILTEATKECRVLDQAGAKQWKSAPILPHPYFASAEIGQDVWLQRHPTYDGRGAVVGIVEFGAPDFLHPEFGPAHTLHGNAVPKFLDVVPVSQPQSEYQHGPLDSFWINVSRQAVAKGQDVVWNGIRYQVPRPGLYAITTLHVPLEETSCGTITASQSFSVLWDGKAKTLRLAPSGSHDFTRAEEIGEYRRAQHFGHIQIAGKAMGYAVFATTDEKYIYISLGIAPHATMTTSTAAGNRLHGGLFTGVAPGAQIISYVDDGYTNHLEGVLKAAADPRVDIVSCSCGIVIPGPQATSAAAVVDHVLARFAQAFHKPLTSASNEVEPAIIGVAPYNGSRMFERNLGITGSIDDMWAPQIYDNGVVYPDILQPERSLAADSRFLPVRSILNFFRTARDYEIGSGSSNATPFAAGMIADLISAEKQQGISVHVRDFRSALWTASSWVSLPNQQQTKQRLPLLEPVWNALKRATRLNVPVFDIRAPIALLGKPITMGQGVLDESATVVHAVRRTVLVTQHGGGAGCCALQLQRNDGSFKIDTHASMKIGNVWYIALTEQALTPGEHIAELDLVDKRTGIVFQAVPLILRTPLAQTTATFVLRGNMQLHQYIAGQLRHPVQFDLTSHGAQNVSFWIRSPDNDFIDLVDPVLAGKSATVAQLQKAAVSVQLQKAAVSVQFHQKDNTQIYTVTIPPGRGLWRLSMSKNEQAADWEKPGPYNPGPPTTVSATVH